MYRKLLTIAFVFTACIDFDIDAPYDDINGIYLEDVNFYSDFQGWKIMVENKKGYILGTGRTDIVCCDLADVYGIDTINVYQSDHDKSDFVVADGYAYIVSPSYLEIVDFNQTNPQLTGSLSISGILYSIMLSDDHAFITGNTKLFAIDVSNVANPVQITEYSFNTLVMKADVVSDTLYVLLQGGILQIIDIATPTSPQLIAEHNLSDTLEQANSFAKNREYLYVSRGNDIETYEILEGGALEYQNTLSFLRKVDFLSVYGEYGLCFHRQFSLLYLLNLSYPSRPCIGESAEPGGMMWHGVIENQYIYFLNLTLSIFEIKEIEP